MIQFLYPVGLLAAAGILVPVVIHLWNIKKGMTLKVGSIALLVGPSSSRSRKLQIRDWPLLLLRVLLVLLAAFLVCQPLLPAAASRQKRPAGWILSSKSLLFPLWKNKKTELKALLQKGYEWRDFDAGFARMDLKDTGTVFSRSSLKPLSYFSLLSQLNALVPEGTTVYLYTDSLQNRFSGPIPELSFPLKWKFFQDSSQDTSFIAGQYQTMDQQLMTITRHSGAAGSYYTQAKKKGSLPDTLKTERNELLIYEEGAAADAAYLRSAVQAISSFTRRILPLRNIRSLAQVNSRTRAVFWLSARPVEEAELRKLPKNTLLFSYAGHERQQIHSFLLTGGQEDGQAPELYQRMKTDSRNGEVIWRDGFGMPLLVLDRSQQLRHYRFYSRLNQRWTELVWTNGMVMAMMPFVLPEGSGRFGFPESGPEFGTLAAVPAMKNLSEGHKRLWQRESRKANQSPENTDARPAARILLWASLLVLLLERILTYQKLKPAHGNR